jgi:UDP-glucose 4-epimerase
VHAADVSRGLELFAREKDKGYAVYNLGSGRETSIAELAQIAARVMEADCAVEFDGEAALGQPVNWRADIGRACEVGYEARVTIEEGVRSLAAWVQAEQGVV